MQVPADLSRFVSFTPPAARPRLASMDWLLAAVFFIAALALYTRHNDFPSFYHPDEPGKARQIITGDFNFNHPMLLLQTTRMIAAIQGIPLTPQPVTEAGRLASAIFAAGAVACLMLVASHWRGPLAALVTGLFLLSNSQLYDLAHYMKEDPSLIFGVAAFFLLLTRCGLRADPPAYALVGAGAALAASGKYLGLLVLPLAFLPVFFRPGPRLRHALLVAGGFAAVFTLVNHPMLFSGDALKDNFSREVGLAVHGQQGMTRPVPHGVYTGVFTMATNPAVWILVPAYYASLLVLRRRIHPAEWALAIFPIVYALVLSFSPKTHHRYFLPDTLLFTTLAAMGLCAFRISPPAWATPVLQVALVIAGLGWSLPGLRAADLAFQNDTRRDLVAYIRGHVPADAVIVQDKRVSLPNRTDPRRADSPYFLDQEVLGKSLAADVGTIDELRRRGIRYIIVSEADYGAYFTKTTRPRAEVRNEFERRKRFYERLFAEGQLLWARKGGTLQYLQPAVKLYYLPPEGPP